LLPEEVLRQPAELARVDGLLDDKLTTRCGSAAVDGLNVRPLRRSCCVPPGCARTRQ
jgi:hypothetical protein